MACSSKTANSVAFLKILEEKEKVFIRASMISQRNRLYLFMILGVFTALCIAYVSVVFFKILVTPQEIKSDFFAYYTAGKMAINTPELLYHLDAQSICQRTWLRDALGLSGLTVLPYLYPPQAIILFIPFATMDYTAALLSWTIFVCFTLFVFLMLVYRFTRLWRRDERWIAILLPVGFYWMMLVLYHGQIVFLLGVGIMGYWMAIRARYGFIAACCAIIVCIKPHLAVVILLHALVFAGRRFWIALFVLCGLLLAATWIAGATNWWHDYLILILQFPKMAYLFDTAQENMVSLKGVQFRLFPDTIYSLFLFYIIAIAASFRLLYKARSPEQEALAFIISFVLLNITSPWLHLPEMWLYAIPLLLLYDLHKRQSEPASWWILLLVTYQLATGSFWLALVWQFIFLSVALYTKRKSSFSEAAF